MTNAVAAVCCVDYSLSCSTPAGTPALQQHKSERCRPKSRRGGRKHTQTKKHTAAALATCTTEAVWAHSHAHTRARRETRSCSHLTHTLDPPHDLKPVCITACCCLYCWKCTNVTHILFLFVSLGLRIIEAIRFNSRVSLVWEVRGRKWLNLEGESAPVTPRDPEIGLICKNHEMTTFNWTTWCKNNTAIYENCNGQNYTNGVTVQVLRSTQKQR